MNSPVIYRETGKASLPLNKIHESKAVNEYNLI